MEKQKKTALRKLLPELTIYRCSTTKAVLHRCSYKGVLKMLQIYWRIPMPKDNFTPKSLKDEITLLHGNSPVNL